MVVWPSVCKPTIMLGAQGLRSQVCRVCSPDQMALVVEDGSRSGVEPVADEDCTTDSEDFFRASNFYDAR